MDDKTQELILAIGALAETSGLLHKELIKNGFSRKEALEIVKSYVAETTHPRNTKED